MTQKQSPPYSNQITSQLKMIGAAQRKLAYRLPPSSDPGCFELKQNQLKGLLNGSYSTIAMMKPRSVEDVQNNLFNPYSSLSMLGVKRMQCDYDFSETDTFLTALDLHHNSSQSWCEVCVRERDGGVDFEKGIINSFSCWRRSGSSEVFGFVHLSEMHHHDNSLIHHPKGLQTSPELYSKIHVEKQRDQLNVSIPKYDGMPNNWDRTSNLMIINLNLEVRTTSDSSVEIQNILAQQMLTSSHILRSSPKPSRKRNDDGARTAAFILEQLDSIHQVWHTEGGSQDSVGILGILALNRGNSNSSSATLMTGLKSFCRERRINFLHEEWKNAHKSMLSDIGVSELSGDLILILVLDSILDLGGVDDG